MRHYVCGTLRRLDHQIRDCKRLVRCSRPPVLGTACFDLYWLAGSFLPPLHGGAFECAPGMKGEGGKEIITGQERYSQPAACNVRHATCGMQRAACNVRHAMGCCATSHRNTFFLKPGTSLRQSLRLRQHHGAQSFPKRATTGGKYAHQLEWHIWPEHICATILFEWW